MMNKIRENQTNDISHQPLNICTNGDVNQHLPTPDHYNNEPYCFVADTDSQQYIIDTGANRVIVNDPSLLANFRASGGGVKGIGGTPVQIRGHGDLTLTIVSDSGEESHKTTFLNAVYVPSSPYNIVPPQLLIANLKDEDDLDVDYAKHDEQNYIISFKKKGLEDEYNTMTIPISNNGLFQFWTKPGYHSFFADASTYQCYECYNGATVIEDYSSDESGNLLQTQDKPREQKPESVEKPREPFNVVPHDHDDDFQSLPSSPREMEPFDTKIDLPLDPNLVILQRKQQVLATIHERLGHLSYSKIKLLARAGLIRSDLANVPPPTCPGCAYGKAHRRPWRHKKKKLPKQSKIKPATKSGQVVSVDQLVSPTPGLIPTHRGNPTTAKYIGATVFVDHYSDLTYVHLMTKLDAESTVNAKLAFERVCDSYGVKVQHYHADNGLFDTKKFKTACEVAQQGLTFCGVNAHHQNGKAENRIKDITTGARTALLHAAHRWPNTIHVSLWPAALKHYVNTRNIIPTQFTPERYDGRKKTPASYTSSPISKFSGTEVEANLDHFHPFGSPVYVLENSLQAGQSHNKWSDRSKVGIFLCHSPHHASNVPLILNTQTANVTPQFHCLYDDEFDTCKRDAKFESLWQYKAKVAIEKLDKPSLDILPTKSTHTTNVNRILPDANDPPPMFTIDWENSNSNSDISETSEQNSDEQSPLFQEIQSIDQTSTADESSIPVELPEEIPQIAHRNSVTDKNESSPVNRVSRFGRQIKRNKRYFGAAWQSLMVFMATYSPIEAYVNDVSIIQPEIQTEPHPYALFAKENFALAVSSDPDTMTLDEAMVEPDRDEFIKAMQKELEDHIQRKHWKVIPAKALPKGRTAIPMVWSMKRKRNPIGEIIKWKARLCAGGHKSIEGMDYWDTYSPVVSWSTVRLIICIAMLMDWHMQSIDFVLAFPQAPIKTDIYMKPPKVPRNFIIPDLKHPSDAYSHFYKLLKNLYGLKDAGSTWFEYLKKGLNEREWKQSEIDSCLFTKPGIILVVYVDDAILISPSQAKIQHEIKSLQKSYDLTDDGELKDYLGTRFERNQQDNSIELTQPKMMERIFNLVNLDPDNDQTKLHDTPACSSKLLDNNPDGKPRVQKWNYRAVVGCLSYLNAMVRPDITMATQQCARFCNNPSREHEEAVKRICRYLLKTKDKGLILRPDKTKGLECYVDADWAGSWQDRSSNDPLSSHSRTGYVILFAGCPIIWTSKMQPLIALSTTEAEYIALSTALREVIAVINLLEELRIRHFPISNATPKVICKVFEDNKSCIEIATNHKTRARTKHLSVRLHHFRSYVVNKIIDIQHISTNLQMADMFTKPLSKDKFEFHRDKLMSWIPTASSRGSEKISRLRMMKPIQQLVHVANFRN